MAGRRDFDSGRFKELALLLVERSKDDPRISRVKLNKLLYRCDFESFRLLGQSITGATYIRGEHGPMAAELPRAEEELGRSGYLEWRQEEAGPHTQKVPVALEPADQTIFSDDELRIIATAIDELRPYGGAAASKWSHEESAGWRLRPDGQEITYESGLIDTTSDLEPEKLAALREYVDTLRK